MRRSRRSADLVDHRGPMQVQRGRRWRRCATARARASGCDSQRCSPNIGRCDSRCAAARRAADQQLLQRDAVAGSGRWRRPASAIHSAASPSRRRCARRRRARSCRRPRRRVRAARAIRGQQRAAGLPAARARRHRAMLARCRRGSAGRAGRACGCRAARRCRTRSRAPPPMVRTRSGFSGATESRLPSFSG
jgi:hypothetical protein